MSTVAVLALGALGGGFVTGLAGFGTGLTALGLWLHVVSPAVAAALVAVCSVAGQIQSLYAVRRGVAWSRAWPFLVGGVLGVPLGVAALRVVDPTSLKIFLGTLLVGYTGLFLVLRRLPIVSAGGKVADGVVASGEARSAAWPGSRARFPRSGAGSETGAPTRSAACTSRST
jgi:uncharacterized protein